MEKNVKYLIESTYKFDPIDYSDKDDDEILSKNDISQTIYKHFPQTFYDLNKIVDSYIDQRKYDFTDIDVSAITDFSYLFYDKLGSVNINLSNWDVSNGTSFRFMFSNNPEFSADLSNWDVSNGINFDYMFNNCVNFDYTKIVNWDFSSCKSAINMFFGVDHFLKSKLNNKYTVTRHNKKNYDSIQKLKQIVNEKRNQYAPCYFPIDRIDLVWISNKLLNMGVTNLNMIDVSKLTNLKSIFAGLINVNGIDISKWDVSNCKDFSYMFLDSDFDGDISDWNVSNGVKFNEMFKNCNNFNCDLSNWDVSNGEEFSYMFTNSKINFDVNKWNISKGKKFNSMFSDCPNLNCDFTNLKKNKNAYYRNMFKNTLNVITPEWYTDKMR